MLINFGKWSGVILMVCVVIAACSTPYKIGRSKYCSDRNIKDIDHCEQEYQKHLQEAMGLDPNLD